MPASAPSVWTSSAAIALDTCGPGRPFLGSLQTAATLSSRRSPLQPNAAPVPQDPQPACSFFMRLPCCLLQTS
eukprot:m.17498 g.17498  ORF g.17498 m.17498 type:complete len:73 (-) comp29269_c0_seq1:94-312(-)